MPQGQITPRQPPPHPPMSHLRCTTVAQSHRKVCLSSPQWVTGAPRQCRGRALSTLKRLAGPLPAHRVCLHLYHQSAHSLVSASPSPSTRTTSTQTQQDRSTAQVTHSTATHRYSSLAPHPPHTALQPLPHHPTLYPSNQSHTHSKARLWGPYSHTLASRSCLVQCQHLQWVVIA